MSTIINQELTKWSAEYRGEKFHAVLCDPPYGLEFMGKEWDAPHKASSFPKAGNLGGFADGNKPSFARQGDLSRLSWVYRVWGEAIMPHLYPGAIVMMFGGTRTWHRLASGMEDAGFKIWDTMMWLYGQGFPKSQDLEKLGAGDSWSGYKTTALKPAWEPIMCFKKPLEGTYAESATKYGSGALNVDGGRVATDEHLAAGSGGLFSHIRDGKSYPGNGRDGKGSENRRYTEKGVTNFAATPGHRGGNSSGRYPSNVCMDEEAATQLDQQTGVLSSGEPMGIKAGGQLNCYGVYAGGVPVTGFGDSGGASRFFYCSKANMAERNVGLDGFESQVKSLDYRKPTGDPLVGRIHGCGIPRKNHHPTVKPIDICRYLATLLLPPMSVKPRRILVPFSGSGSEMIGCMLAGWDEIVGVEQDVDHGYVKIAEARLDWWKWAHETSRLTEPNAILQRFGLIEETNSDQTKLFEQGTLGL
jgi:site-specific DNA-methyltransferase (adenine-specific)